MSDSTKQTAASLLWLLLFLFPGELNFGGGGDLWRGWEGCQSAFTFL